MALFEGTYTPALNDNGNPISGAQWKFYLSGTTTPVAVYSDSGLSTSLGATVTADLTGRFPPIFYNSEAETRARLVDAAGDLVGEYDFDPISAPLSGSGGSALVGFIQSGTGAVGRTAQAKMRDIVSATDFGAVGDGVANDRSALLLADAVGQFLIPRGTFLITANTTLSSDIRFKGGKIKVDNCTLTLNGGLPGAPINQIFELVGTGAVVLNPATNPVARPEWWGCPIGADAYAPITKAMASGVSEVRLMARDYNTTASILSVPYVDLVGSGSVYESGPATRLLGIGQLSPIYQVGVTGYPGSLNDCPHGGGLRNVFVSRNALPTLASDNIGVLVAYSRLAELSNVWSDVSINSFRIDGAIHPKIDDCRAKRSVVSTTNVAGANDKWRGFDLPGTSALGAAGANASVYMNRCATELNVTITDSVALNIAGRFADTFVTDFETVSGSVGMRIIGNRGIANSATARGSNRNIIITRPKFDQSTFRGIEISDVNKWGKVTIIEPYVGPSSGEGGRMTNCEGKVQIIGGGEVQMEATGLAAIVFDTCRSPEVDGLTVNDCSSQAFVLVGTRGALIRGATQNSEKTLSAAAQLIATCTRNIIDLAVDGEAGKAGMVIQSLAASNDFNEFHKTRNIIGGTFLSVSGGEAGSITYGV